MNPENINHFYKNINNLPLKKGEKKNYYKYIETKIFKNRLMIYKDCQIEYSSVIWK